MQITLMCDCCTYADSKISSEIEKFKQEINERLNSILMQNEELKKQNEELKKQNEEKPATIVALPKILNPIHKFISTLDFDKCRELCTKNKPDELKVYLDEYHDAATKKDSTLLTIAARHGEVACVKLLLDNGADIYAQDGYAVCVAAANGHLACVKLLLEYRANTQVQKDYALYLAATFGRVDCIKLLLDAGANVHANADRAFCVAAANGHLACVKLLLAAGADIHAGEDSAIHSALHSNKWAVVEFLAESGANVRAGNDLIIKYLITGENLSAAFTKKIVAAYLKYGGDGATAIAEQYMACAVKESKFAIADIFHKCGVVLKKKVFRWYINTLFLTFNVASFRILEL